MRNNTRKFTSPLWLVAIWLVGYMGLIPVWQNMQSPSNWLEVESVRVNSHFQGSDPSMLVQRSLNLERPTRGVWVTKIVNKRNEVVCTNDGTALYTPKARLPLPESLKLFDWWMDAGRSGGPDRICLQWPLPAGEYCLQTFWEFFPPGYPGSKHVDAPLSCFLVLQKPWYMSILQSD